MPNQSELNVNVHRSAFKQHKANPSYDLQGLLDGRGSWWKRYWDDLFRWEHNLTVAGRTIEKGWVIPQPLGIALLLAMLSCTGVLYWRIIDKQSAMDAAFTERLQEQRDMLVEMKTALQMTREHENERYQELKQNLTDTQESAAAWRELTNKELAQIKAKLR